MTSKKKVFTALAVVVLILIVWTAWSNTALELNTYTLTYSELPDAFDGYRIVHISDLHNAEMGENNEKLLSLIREAKPDIIAVTGDLIDSRRTDIDIALQFAKEAVKIAPCYYVTGNHEARIDEYTKLRDGLIKLGVTVLDDMSVKIEKSDEHITLLGVNDPSFVTDYLFGDDTAVVDSELKQLKNEEDAFTVLLSHRPELFPVYCENGANLVLSGHAHGGQFRLPFVGGLFAPNQGIFPKYDAGIYTEKRTSMIVSRGIGNSLMPFRFNNRPEIIVAVLQTN